MISKLSKNHKILCTSRAYHEVVELAKIKKVKLRLVGKHGGSTREGKLHSSIKRMEALSKVIESFSPDLTISFSSPEAARVAYGLGIKHISFSDSPHAEAVMRLSVPFAQKLLIPWVIPKKEFVRYGISENDIIHYRAIDASVIVREKSRPSKLNLNRDKKTIVIRPEESEAAYIRGKSTIDGIIDKISNESKIHNVVVLSRYVSQRERLKKKFGDKITLMDRVVDGKSLLNITDVFVGSGGTMTAEAALMGIPTISYHAVPNYIEDYLVRVGLVKRETDPKKVAILVNKILDSGKDNRRKARAILGSMEDPYQKLSKIISKM